MRAKEGRSSAFCLLRLNFFPPLYITIGRKRAAVAVAVFQPDPLVVQVGPHFFGKVDPRQPMLHQPAAQLLIRSDVLYKLVLAQTGSNAENIIQAVNALSVQGPPEDVLLLCAHAIDLL